MDAGIYLSLYVVVENEEGKMSIFFLPWDLQTRQMFVPRKPLSVTARRAGWQGYTIDTLRECGTPTSVSHTRRRADLNELSVPALSLLAVATGLERASAAALAGGDVDGAYVAAYDAYRMAAESLLARQGLRATGGDGSHMAVEDAVAAQFVTEIPEFAKPTFERFRRTRHSAQYFDPDAAPITEPDASWAIEKAATAVSRVRALLESPSSPGWFG